MKVLYSFIILSIFSNIISSAIVDEKGELIVLGNKNSNLRGRNSNGEAFSVQSFNIRCANDTLRYGRDGSVLTRAPRVMELIFKYRPLTIGFQEVTTDKEKLGGNDWYSILKQGLDQRYGNVCRGRDGEFKDEANPIFYDKEKLELIESGTKWLSPTPDVPGSQFPSTPDHPTDGMPRICTYVVVKVKTSGFTYMHINTHLDYKYYINRRSQAEVLMNFAKQYSDKMPVIVTGDFNSGDTEPDKENNDAIPYLLNNGFVSAALEAPTTTDHRTYEVTDYHEGLYDNCETRGYHANGKTLAEQPDCSAECDREHGSIIDYCLKLNNGRTTFSSYKVLDDLDAEGKIASDHYSIYVTGMFQ